VGSHNPPCGCIILSSLSLLACLEVVDIEFLERGQFPLGGRVGSCSPSLACIWVLTESRVGLGDDRIELRDLGLDRLVAQIQVECVDFVSSFEARRTPLNIFLR